jgi:3-oxoacyl-[acyl-carrier-protein] synthase II
MRRVAVTGMAGITALGNDWPTIEAAFRTQRTGVRAMAPEWDRFTGVNTRLAAPVLGFVAPDHWPRKKTRTMGRVATMAVAASEAALTDAGLLGDAVVKSGRTGVAYGSSFGSPDAVLGFFELKMNGTSRNLNATTYIQMMSHTALVNIGLFFGA